MATWSQKKKTLYGGITVVLLSLAIGLPAFLILYKAPTCFDGKLNGNETGIDCGGSCVRLCASAFLPPSVGWTRFEEIAPGMYNVAAFIINQNDDAEARGVPYRMILYDRDGLQIVSTENILTIPVRRNALAFATAVDVGNRKPYKAFFEILSTPNWTKLEDPLQNLRIGEKVYTEEGGSSSLLIEMENLGVKALPRMSVYVVLYDADKNAIGFSKTLIDRVAPKTTVVAPFTWPVSRDGKVISIEVLPVAE